MSRSVIPMNQHLTEVAAGVIIAFDRRARTEITPGLRRHRRVGLPEELIQSPLRGGKQACLDVFDGLVCRGRHEVGAETYQGFTNR